MKNPLISIDYSKFKNERVIYDPLMSLLLESGRINDEYTARKSSNRRRHERFKCDLPIVFDCSEWTYKGTIRNISLGGLYIETSDPFSKDQRIQLTLCSLSLQRTCNVACRIMRRDPAGIGIEFMALSMAQQRIIATIIEEIKTPSANQETIAGSASQ